MARTYRTSAPIRTLCPLRPFRPAMRYDQDMHRMATLPVGAYPNLSQLSAILRVPKSTLADRKVAFEHVGREKRIAPRTVLELAAYFHQRALQDVAADLVAHARRAADTKTARHVEDEVAEALRAVQQTPPETVNLDELSQEFDRLLERMQDPEYGRRIRDAFDSLRPADFGRAAVAAARRRRSTVHA